MTDFVEGDGASGIELTIRVAVESMLASTKRAREALQGATSSCPGEAVNRAPLSPVVERELQSALEYAFELRDALPHQTRKNGNLVDNARTEALTRAASHLQRSLEAIVAISKPGSPATLYRQLAKEYLTEASAAGTEILRRPSARAGFSPIFLDANVLMAQNGTDRASRSVQRILRLAVYQLPRDSRDRYQEEWEAEVRDLPRRQRWAYALGLLLRARATARSVEWRPRGGLERQRPW